jgi:hypothetical protein
MKEVQKKDVPEVSGGQAVYTPLPAIVVPYPACPTVPGGWPDPNDPLGDGTHPVQS